MIEPLSSRIHFAVFGPDVSYDDGFPDVTDTAFLREHVSGGKTLAAFRVALPNESEKGLFVLTMHPHIIGQRSRIWILEELIRFARSLDGVWFATHADIARYCATEADLGTTLPGPTAGGTRRP